MEFTKINNFKLGHNKLDSFERNTPPSKKQKLSNNLERSTSLTLRLNALDDNNIKTPQSHQINCYRNLTYFLGNLIDGTINDGVKVHTLQANVRDLVRIYDKSSDLYTSIQREVRRGLAALSPKSFNHERGQFIKNVVDIWNKVDNWMRIIRYVFADLDRLYAAKQATVDSLKDSIERLFKDIILSNGEVRQILLADLSACLGKVREPLHTLKEDNEVTISEVIESSIKCNEVNQVRDLFQVAENLNWEVDIITSVYLDTMEVVIRDICHTAIKNGTHVNKIIGKICQHCLYEDTISKSIDSNFSWDNLEFIAKHYLSLTFDEIVKKGVDDIVPYSWTKSSASRNVFNYDEIPSTTYPDTGAMKSLHHIASRTDYKEELDRVLLERIYNVIKTFVSDEENDQYLIITLIGTLRELNKFYKEVYQIKSLTSSYSLYKESFDRGLQFRANKPAEMIAKFLDNLLKDKRGQGDNMDKLVDGAVELFRIVKDKDMFSAFYTLALARRLVKSTTASNDNERNLISRITKVAGNDFTQNWEEMMKDVEISEELSNKFREQQTSECRLQKANIVQAARWPFKGQHLSLKLKDLADKDASEIAKQANLSQGNILLPQWMTEELVQFTRYYEGVHAKRCLTWNHSLGEVTLSSEFETPNGEYTNKEIIMPLPASLILMVFNEKEDNEKVSYGEIQQGTGLLDGELKRMLQSLAFGKIKLLQRYKKKDGSATKKDIEPTDSFVVSKTIDHPRKRFRLPIITAEVDVEESKETTAEVESARVFALQASAVRILKAKKRINVNELIHEVIGDIAKRMTLENETGLTRQIKQTIEGLIEKDYAERVEGNRNMLEYVA